MKTSDNFFFNIHKLTSGGSKKKITHNYPGISSILKFHSFLAVC